MGEVQGAVARRDEAEPGEAVVDVAGAAGADADRRRRRRGRRRAEEGTALAAAGGDVAQPELAAERQDETARGVQRRAERQADREGGRAAEIGRAGSAGAATPFRARQPCFEHRAASNRVAKAARGQDVPERHKKPRTFTSIQT